MMKPFPYRGGPHRGARSTEAERARANESGKIYDARRALADETGRNVRDITEAEVRGRTARQIEQEFKMKRERGSTFGSLVSGCERLGETPTGSSIWDLKERAQVAAQKAAHHAAAGHKSLARSWANAAARMRKELQAKLKHTDLGELADLGIGTPTKVLVGGGIIAGLGYAGLKWLKSTNLNNLLKSDAKRAELAEET